MPAQGFSSSIDTGLPDNPVDVKDELYEQFQAIFNAIKILQQAIGSLTGNQTTDLTNFLSVAQQFKDTLQIGRMAVIQVIAGQALVAGNIVNIYDAGGNILRVRKADASLGIGARAHGYVEQSYNVGDLCAVFLWSGYLAGSGFVAGQWYYLSSTTPGGITTVAPVTPGMIKQEVGTGLGLTDFAVKIATPIIL